jgi:hypothetical protein
MASGTIYGSTGNQYIDSKIEWSSTPDNSANTSSVTAKLYYKRNNTGFVTSGSGYFSITIDGQSESAFASLNIKESSWVLAVTVTKTVSHNVDGSKSLTISSTGGSIMGTTLTSTSCSGRITLDTIPRASSITSANSVTLGSKCKIVWTPASASFYYRVKFSLSVWSYTTEAFKPGTTSAYTYTGFSIPMFIASFFSKRKRSTMTATLYTYSDSGTTQVGSESSKNFTVTLSDNESTKPSLDMTLSPDTPYEKFASLYLQGRSKVKASFSGEGKYGASIISYGLQVEGKKISSPYISDLLAGSGEATIVGTATDSRGFTKTVSQKINIIAYEPPYIAPYSGHKSIICERCMSDGTVSDTGTYLHIKGTRNYTKINSNGITNTCSVWCRYKPEGGNWSHTSGNGVEVLLWSDTSTDAFDVILPNIVTDTRLSYTVELNIVDDTYMPSTMEFNIPSEDIEFELRDGGKGAAFGKHSVTENLLEVEWDSQFNGKSSFAGLFLKEKEVIVEGDDNTYYPVHIKPAYYSLSQPAFVGIGKALGTASGTWEGNHYNGTSPLAIGWLLRYNGLDGNGSINRTLFKVEEYAPLIAHAEGLGNSATGFVVYLRGGGAAYKVACSVPFDVKVYLSDANISEQDSYTVTVSPKTTMGNKGILYKNTGEADIVIEQGSSDFWYYRKWESGRMECWGRKQFTVDITTAWGTLFYGTVNAVTFPIAFVDTPMCQVSAEFGDSSPSAWLCVNGKSTTTSAPSVMFCRPTSAENRGFYIIYYAIGRWK